jgi:hypothetical protein
MTGRLLDVNRGSCKIDKGNRVGGEQKRGARGAARGVCEELGLVFNDGVDAVVCCGCLPLMGKQAGALRGRSLPFPQAEDDTSAALTWSEICRRG